MNLRRLEIASCFAFTISLPALAEASPPTSEDPTQPQVGTGAGELDDRKDQPWIERWAPEDSMVELGVYGGILMPTPDHELFEPDLSLPDQGHEPFVKIAPDVGLRLGYYPSRFFGIEAEGGVMPTELRDGGAPALLYTFRGHLIAQLGLWSVTPFVLIGAGGLGIASDADVLGNDLDPALHFGGGIKFYLSRYVMLRVDVRDIVSHQQGVDEVFNAHNLEVLLGLSFTFGRERDRRISDPITPAMQAAPADRDGDGILDAQDTCPDAAETINEYLDDDGCPEVDSDGDGFWDEQDSCPNEPETVNGFQDQDGCPDEVPAEVRAFTGAIAGITFENNSDEIRGATTETLDRAVIVLTNNPDVRIRVVGHTDNRGDREHNLDLSKRRAAAVKTYLVERGIAEDRIVTEGMGPDVPVDSNDSRAGRANNRRIEFEILQGTQATPTPTP